MITQFVKSFLLACAIAAISGVSSFAQTSPVELPQYQVKAAFIYNFIKFVEWPEESFSEKNSPYVIGVLGTDPFFESDLLLNYLNQAVEGKTINNREILVKPASPRISDFKDCHLVFISASEKNRMKEILAGLNQPGLLTISETDNFCEQGGMINFFMASGKVRFEINAKAAEKAGLKISSKLLNVAKIVSTKSR